MTFENSLSEWMYFLSECHWAEKGLDISLKMPNKLVIRSDKRRVKEVLINFVGNAVKFTDRGWIEIRVVPKERMVEVSVKDSGLGIKNKDIDRLFKAFSQVFEDDRAKQEGTVPGLYLSKKIIDLLQGKIWAESVYGEGSEFIFTLPLKYKI